MKAASIVIVIVLALALIRWVLGGEIDIHLARLLPFIGGHSVGIYDVGALVVVGITIIGLLRLWRASDDS